MFKTIFGSKLADRSKALFSRLESIARKTRLIQRTSKKFSAAGFVLGLFKAVQTGKASFNQLAINLGLSEAETLTSQAVWDRIDEDAVSFMVVTNAEAMKEQWSEEALIASKRFNRVIIEDSTQSKTDKRNAEDFPAHGNDKGKTAGCKVDFAFDLLSGNVVYQSLCLATEQDREIGKDLVDLVEEKDLVMRDMGYFSLGEFALIEARGAFWLSRLPVSVKAHDCQGKKIETILRGTKRNRIDCQMFIGEALHPVRMIAKRAAPEIASEKRRQRREDARKLGKVPSKDVLTRDGWHIIITNIDSDLMEEANLFRLYSVRWQIEIAFRAWKQSSNLRKALARKSNTFHLQCLILAAILLLILTMKLAALLRASYRQYELSIEKIADSLMSFILSLASLDHFSDYSPDPRHLRMDRRSRDSLGQTAATCLA